MSSRPAPSKKKLGPHGFSPNPRRHALEVVSQALSPTGRAFARELLDERLTHAPLNPEDRRLAADLTYGVIRRLGTLDAVVAAYAERPLQEIEPVVRQILRLGAYQLLYLDRVPNHAAVDESVRLAHATGKQHASGFVNAVLRSIAGEVKFADRADPAKPRHSFELRPGRACAFSRPILPPPADQASYLAAAQSYPRWLVLRWLARYGTSRTRELCATANEPPPLFVRVNLLRTTMDELVSALREQGVEAVPSPSGRTLRLPPHTRVDQLRPFHEGLFLVQDDSGAAVVPFLGPRPGEQVLDLCAAPGGKTCHLAELMQGRGQIVAVDSSKPRLQKLVDSALRLNHRTIAAVASEGANFAVQHRARFDRVLLDAPCSNTGVLRRRVEARWRLSDEVIASLSRRQRALLEAALICLKPSGSLVYSTCSLEPEENAELVRVVLSAVHGFRLDDEVESLPSRNGGEGGYMARIVRERQSPGRSEA